MGYSVPGCCQAGSRSQDIAIYNKKALIRNQGSSHKTICADHTLGVEACVSRGRWFLNIAGVSLML
jgi:hypothetical protein